VVTRKHGRHRFAICIRNEGSDDLALRKVYRVLPDEGAQAEKLLRVVDDSGEDYLYPASYFVLVEFPQAVERRLLATPTASGT